MKRRVVCISHATGAGGEEVGRLLSAVAGLGGRDREIIGLRYGSGLDTREVAEILRVTEATARTRLWRALARLREVLRS